jgi:polygalacturonase
MTATAVGLFAITGNLLGSQDAVLHLQSCRGVVVSGNAIYSGYTYAILAEDAEHLVISGNSIDHNPEYRGKSTDRAVFKKCRGVNVSGTIQQHTLEPLEQPPASMEIIDCENVTVTGCQILNARQRGILMERSKVVRVADCTIRGRPGDATYRLAMEIAPGCSQIMATHNFLGKGSDGAWRRPENAGMFTDNVEV